LPCSNQLIDMNNYNTMIGNFICQCQCQWKPKNISNSISNLFTIQRRYVYYACLQTIACFFPQNYALAFIFISSPIVSNIIVQFVDFEYIYITYEKICSIVYYDVCARIICRSIRFMSICSLDYDPILVYDHREISKSLVYSTNCIINSPTELLSNIFVSAFLYFFKKRQTPFYKAILEYTYSYVFVEQTAGFSTNQKKIILKKYFEQNALNEIFSPVCLIWIAELCENDKPNEIYNHIYNLFNLFVEKIVKLGVYWTLLCIQSPIIAVGFHIIECFLHNIEIHNREINIYQLVVWFATIFWSNHFAEFPVVTATFIVFGPRIIAEIIEYLYTRNILENGRHMGWKRILLMILILAKSGIVPCMTYCILSIVVCGLNVQQMGEKGGKNYITSQDIVDEYITGDQGKSVETEESNDRSSMTVNTKLTVLFEEYNP
jgi:hypothetical protein